MLLLGTVVTTDAGEEGEPLHREGEHILPTCSDCERLQGSTQQFARCGRQVAWQRGGKAQLTEAMRGGRHLRCVGTRAGARGRGARGGACAECARVLRAACANLQEKAEVLWRHAARPPPPLPHPSSITH